MALAISNVLQCPNSQFSRKNFSLKGSVSSFSSSVVRFRRTSPQDKRVICASSSAAGSSGSDSDFNPYQVLGVSPIEGFDVIKAAYTRKHKDAERRGDEVTAAQVSKDIKYADKQPVLPWGPRFTKSSVQDMRINLAISAVFTAWVFIKRNAEWKPLQFLAFVFVYRIFEKLKAFEPPTSPTFTEEGEDEGRALRMGKRLLRSLALVFGCIALSSLGFTGVLNLIEFVGSYIPAFLYNNQELFVTASTALMLYVLASYYR
ncbi:hypothetical protein CsSME_00027835 [Camellia sinensis var. sinensis]